MPPRRRSRFPHDTDLKRRPAGTHVERSSFLLACEGKTERLYFNGFKGHSGPAIVICPAERHVDGMITQIDDLRGEASLHDQVWLVVDADGRDLQPLVDNAAGTGVRLAVSRPCFELWLLLHLVDFSRPEWRCEPLKRKLRAALPGWSEGSTRFSDFAGGVDDACKRARLLEPTGAAMGHNPSTNVWRLVEAIKAVR